MAWTSCSSTPPTDSARVGEQQGEPHCEPHCTSCCRVYDHDITALSVRHGPRPLDSLAPSSRSSSWSSCALSAQPRPSAVLPCSALPCHWPTHPVPTRLAGGALTRTCPPPPHQGRTCTLMESLPNHPQVGSGCAPPAPAHLSPVRSLHCPVLHRSCTYSSPCHSTESKAEGTGRARTDSTKEMDHEGSKDSTLLGRGL